MNKRRTLRLLELTQQPIFVGVTIIALTVLLVGRLDLGGAAGPEPAAAVASIPGAVGHFEVSSVEELRQALTALPVGGGTIQLRDGDYLLDSPLEIRGRNSVNLCGSGWSCRLIRRGDGDALVLIDAGFCQIRSLLILGAEAAKSGSAIVFQRGCSSNTIDGCRIVNFPESGVRFEGDAQHPMSSNTVRDCHFIGNLGDQLFSQNNNDFYIVGNQFGTHRGNPRTGCVLDRSSAGSYSLNYHWGNQVALKVGPAANFNRIENNRFEECRESALVIGSESANDWNAFHIITGNTFHTNSQAKPGEYAAIVASHAHDITFCQNQVFSWDSKHYRHKHSLVINANCSRWIVKDNHFRHNTGEALVTHAETGMLIKDNLTD